MQDCEQRQQNRSDAERHDAIAFSAVNRPQNEPTEQSGPCPEDEHASTVTVPKRHKAMVKVALVSVRDTASRAGTANDGEQGVDHGDAQDHEWDQQWRKEEEGTSRIRAIGSPTHDHRGRGHEETEQQRTGITHEDPSGMDVVRQESDTRSKGKDCNQGSNVPSC
jgi:hypothetical protein